VQFFNKKGKLLATHRQDAFKDKKFMQKETILKDGERILGFKGQ